MMVTAMETKNASNSSGIMPSAVVEAAMATGRRRLTPESRIAAFGALPSASCRLISSMSTMAFLMSMPIKLRKPSVAMKPNGWPVSSNPPVTPITASGTHSQMISG